MGKRLRRIARGGVPTIGVESSWKEDLLSLMHLAHCLGFPSESVSAQVWRAEKSGHFMPGIVITAGTLKHAFTLGDVPGTQAAAALTWREFRAGVAPEAVGNIFLASQIADPLFIERLCDSIESAGIEIPAKSKPAAPALTPVGAR